MRSSDRAGRTARIRVNDPLASVFRANSDDETMEARSAGPSPNDPADQMVMIPEAASLFAKPSSL
jgi:hypothetical protein